MCRKPSIKTLKGFIYLKGARRAQSRFLSAYAALKPDAPLLKEELGDFCRDYDLIFTGSDQVWNPVFAPGEHPLRFLLDFVEDDAKKVAYAPSFGTRTLDEDYADEFRCLLPKFSHLSVRESAGQEIIRKLTGLCPPVVADPTLLMNCDDWKSYASKPGIKDYIFLYEKDHNDELESFARCFSSKTGLKVIRKSMPNTHSKAITSRLVSALELFFFDNGKRKSVQGCIALTVPYGVPSWIEPLFWGSIHESIHCGAYVADCDGLNLVYRFPQRVFGVRRRPRLANALTLRGIPRASLRLRTDIIGDTMYITTQKTHDRLPININKFAQEILDKYDGHTYVGNTALPVISNQR